ncbi:hypothetical protein FRB93_012460 [Tulasnella sp. JGI-2019a]|nr:hypothetical protein FRB93_012460 [Tulasnella sp. JGI-2019a]
MFSPSQNSSTPGSRSNSPPTAKSLASPDVNGEAGSSNPPSGSSRPRRSNPLIDLIDSEKDYVDLLAGIIRKVASAWSRANFPPTELDAMFRAVEAIFRTNRGFLAKLKDIGPNPSSPKALGDLLMRWIEDLEAPYSRYCNSFTAGFDSWDRVQSNPALQPLLDEVTNAHPPTPADGVPLTWTLDSLFILPRLRLKYYKKLYARLLKSTQPGRSDHRLLVSANEKLDGLILVINDRLNYRVGESEPSQIDTQVTVDNDPGLPSPPPPPPAKQSNGIHSTLPPLPDEIRAAMERTNLNGSSDIEPQGDASVSSGSDRFSRDNTDNDRLSRDTGVTSVSAGRSPSTMSNGPDGSQRISGPSPAYSNSPPPGHQRTVSDIERMMDTSRVLDIFTMRPKPCKLQIARPLNPLPFVRSVRFEADVEISIAPKATGVEVLYERGHVVMLTDLFLVGEWMDGEMLSLCFPPLAARHLTIVDEPISLGEGMDRSFQIQVMRRESLVVRTDSLATKERLVRQFGEAIDNATNLVVQGRPPGDGPPLNVPLPPSGASSRSMSPNPNVLPPMPSTDSNSEGRRDSNQSHDSRRGSSSTNAVLSPRNSEHGTFNSYTRPNYGSEASFDSNNQPRGFPPSTRGPPSNGLPGPRGSGGPPPGQPPRFGSGPPPGSGPWSPAGNSGPFPPGRSGSSPGPMYSGQPGMPPGGPPGGPGLRKSPSGRSLGSTKSHHLDEGPLPPLPGMPPQQQQPPGPGGFNGLGILPNGMRPGPFAPAQQQHGGYPPSPSSFGRPGMPPIEPDDDFNSPPPSPVQEEKIGPSVISAQMKCKVFLKQQHGQWKALGSAKLKLYEQQPRNVKQLVVEAESKSKDLIISTIILTDGVERVGRTGIAVELSDKGVRTDIVYMIQLRNETSASGLFNSLLAGSDRSTAVRK